MAAFPSPVESEAFPVPSNHGFRLHNQQRRLPTIPESGEPDPEDAIPTAHLDAMSCFLALKSDELMAQRNYFSL
jgi:hypothetical protein